MPARCPRLIIRKARNLYGLGFLNGGGGGIRTHGTRERSTVFKTAPINRSGTPPKLLDTSLYYYIIFYCQVIFLFCLPKYFPDENIHAQSPPINP